MRRAGRIPEGSVLFLGILNTLRTWNYFDLPDSVYGYANTGGFGIDGYISSFMGASWVHPDKLYFCVAGDLAFFYDMNVLGNRHVGRNVRILLVNNGKGTEFRNYMHPRRRPSARRADDYIAAAGHYGNKSRQLVRHYAEDLGYEYLSAENKEDYLRQLDRFLAPGLTGSSHAVRGIHRQPGRERCHTDHEQLERIDQRRIERGDEERGRRKGERDDQEGDGEMKERESWFDFLRGVAVLMVIAIHTFAATSQKRKWLETH